MIKKIKFYKEKIKLYKGLLIEICETLCSICLYLDFDGRHGSRNPNAEFMRLHFNELKRYSAALVAVKCGLDKIPTIEPSAEPVRMKGQWSVTPDDGRLVCSCCYKNPTNRIIVNGNLIYDMTPIRKRMKFCPNCGADMRGGQE